MKNKPIRIVIVDDQTIYARTLGFWLGRKPGMEIAGYAADGQQGWQLCTVVRPDVALVDVDMPVHGGLVLTARLLEELPDIRVILMTGLVNPHTTWKALEAGVPGLLDKTMEPELLEEAVRLVADGGTFISPAFQAIKTEYLMRPEAFQKILSDREQAVLRLVAQGVSDDAIGTQLGITPSTVAFHRKKIRLKLGVHNDRDLLAYARQWGLQQNG
jgi:DNA-binding NarL/FixJ family response regulator